MSPEQLMATDLETRPGAAHIDGRSDIFSLGIILYELLTAIHPFGPVPLKLATADLRKHLLGRQREGPRPVRVTNRRVDAGLARIIESCLAYNPNHRPQSAAMLARELRKSLTRVRRVRRWAAFHPRVAAATIFVTVATTLTGAYGIAVQDPEYVRQLNRGIALYAQGEFDQAEKFLERAIDGGSKDGQAYFIRGRVRQHLEDADAALVDYERASKLLPQDGRIKACRAYCLSLRGTNDMAVPFYLEALAAGFRTPEVFNNLGFSLSASAGRNLLILDQAEEAFNEAVRQNPGLQPVFHNLAQRRRWPCDLRSASRDSSRQRRADRVRGGEARRLQETTLHRFCGRAAPRRGRQAAQAKDP
jgi:tetratricopeptide (TPR) repeat protein